MSGAAGASGGNSGYRAASGAQSRSYEERAQAKEEMMASVRESSQQERRVYVGNLSYDVKWHHLKDFMRQGTCFSAIPTFSFWLIATRSWRSSLCRCATASEWNVEGGRLYAAMAGFFLFLWLSFSLVGLWIDGLGRCPLVM